MNKWKYLNRAAELFPYLINEEWFVKSLVNERIAYIDRQTSHMTYTDGVPKLYESFTPYFKIKMSERLKKDSDFNKQLLKTGKFFLSDVDSDVIYSNKQEVHKIDYFIIMIAIASNEENIKPAREKCLFLGNEHSMKNDPLLTLQNAIFLDDNKVHYDVISDINGIAEKFKLKDTLNEQLPIKETPKRRIKI